MENLTLFSDSETFTRKRPTVITEQQKKEFYESKAKEIIDNDWSSDDIDDIVKDLQSLSRHDNGYELAKDLESFSKYASYDIDADFVEWLDSFGYDYDYLLRSNIKTWVNAHNIEPKLELGTKLIAKKNYGRSFSAGDILYVTSHYKPEAQYAISKDKEKQGGNLFKYEDIEDGEYFIIE